MHILYHRKAPVSTAESIFVTFPICIPPCGRGAHGMNEMLPLCPEKAKNAVDTA